jgi:hypothetical protein
MSVPLLNPGAKTWDLPPLILYPFNEKLPPSTLLENSKVALMLSGLLPSDGASTEDLRRRLLAGRYGEIRMLFFLGKDVCRWIDQCMDCVSRIPELGSVTLEPQSFAGLLTGSPPENVKDKLTRWGVSDYTSIFSRAIGLRTVFSEPPALESLAEKFLRGYHRYADALYKCYMDSQPHPKIEAESFRFEMYASGEYSRLLEKEWDTP